MKWIAKALLASMVLPSALVAKGLDKLQPATVEPADDSKEKDFEAPKADKKPAEAPAEKKPDAAVKEADSEPQGEKKAEAEADKDKKEPKAPEPPIEAGFQRWYIGTSLGIMKTTSSQGAWNSSSTGDLELANKLIKQYQGKFDIFGTFRYRPSAVTVKSSSRAYRGVVETYLLGGKGQMELRPKLFAVASAELGLARVALRPIDGIPTVDGALEKSGVDLTIGAGVSYLVLDKIAVGTQLHLGLGTYKSTQFGVDFRFLL